MLDAQFVSTVMPDGNEAWTTVRIGDRELTFDDTRFCLCRATYVVDQMAPWRVSAIATDAGPGGEEDDSPSRMATQVTDVLGDRIDLSRMACLLTLPGDPGCLAFLRGPVRTVRPVRFAGIDAWELDVEVPLDPDSDERLVLPVLVGRACWTGRKDPVQGGFLESVIRLQGYRSDIPFALAP